jgi:DNA-binding response OmpR family regulator
VLLNILIVEDETSLARMLRVILREAGHRVLGPVSTVDDALILIETTTPDIALIDIYLADGSEGSELAIHLAEKKQTSVIFTTADTERAQMFSAYAVGLIEKPYPLSCVLPSIHLVEAIQKGERIENLPDSFRLFHFPPEILHYHYAPLIQTEVRN